MAIQTVRGSINAAQVGLALMHEHLYGDFWTSYYGTTLPLMPEGEGYNRLITLETLHLVRRNPGALKDNLILTDEALTLEELKHFKRAGGGLIVDATPSGASPFPAALLRMSEAANVDIVSATGYFMSQTLNNEVRAMSATQMARRSIADIQEGYADSSLKAGIIGEVGAVGELDELEKRVLEATAITQKETGACVTLHTACPNTLYSSKLKIGWGERTLRVLDYLESQGADLSRIVVGHADADVKTTLKEQIAVLARGVVLEYDNFGQEHPYDEENTYGPSDWQRVQNIVELIAAGYCTQLVLCTDVWQKAQYTNYGGYGLVHIPQNICPMLRRNGISEQQVRQITVLTPTRLLDMNS